MAFDSSKDTTLYLSSFGASKGAGTLLWAGAEVEFVGSGQFGFWSRRSRRRLLDRFDLATLVFIPDGVLRRVPMAALHNGEEYLIERYALDFTPGLEAGGPAAHGRAQA